MRTTLALAATLLHLVLANPLPAPYPLPANTSSTAAPAASTIPDSYIIVYKKNTADADVEKYHGDVYDALGEKPYRAYNFNGFKAVHVKTDAAGLEKIGNSSLVRIMPRLFILQLSLFPLLFPN